MRWIVIATLVVLAGCGMSAEEKTNFAAATCSLLSEYSESDGVARMKELNSARESLQLPLFLGSGEDIQDALEYGLCSDLILNVSEYDNRLAKAKQSRADKVQQFLSGAWFLADNASNDFFVVAEFREDELVLTHYSYEKNSTLRRELYFRTEVFSDSGVIASGSGKDDFTIHLDTDGNTIRLDAFDCTIDEECNFKKAPHISLTDISGKWLEIGPHTSESPWMDEYLVDSYRYYWRDYNHENKTFQDITGSCGFELKSGFTIVHLCEGDPLYLSFVTKYSHSKMQIYTGVGFTEYKRITEFPSPRAGYRDTTIK